MVASCVKMKATGVYLLAIASRRNQGVGPIHGPNMHTDTQHKEAACTRNRTWTLNNCP